MAGLEKAFGSALRELRNQRALSQEALAFEAELARNYISQLELGSKSPLCQYDLRHLPLII